MLTVLNKLNWVEFYAIQSPDVHTPVTQVLVNNSSHFVVPLTLHIINQGRGFEPGVFFLIMSLPLYL